MRVTLFKISSGFIMPHLFTPIALHNTTAQPDISSIKIKNTHSEFEMTGPLYIKLGLQTQSLVKPTVIILALYHRVH